MSREVQELWDLLDRGEAFHEAGSDEQALVSYARVLERFGLPFGQFVFSETASGGSSVRGEHGRVHDTSQKPGSGSLGIHISDAEDIVAVALISSGLSFRGLARPEAELAAFEKVLSLFSGSKDPRTRAHIAGAMWNKANTLLSLSRQADAANAFAALVSSFEDADDPAVRVWVSWALWQRIQLLQPMGSSAELLGLYVDLVERRDELADPTLSDAVAWCLQQLGDEFHHAGRLSEESAVLDDLVARFSSSSDQVARTRAATVFLARATRLVSASEFEEAVATCDEMLERFADASSSDLRRVVFGGFYAKCDSLLRLGRADEALGACDAGLAFVDAGLESAERLRRFQMLAFKARQLRYLGRDAEMVAVADAMTTALRKLGTEAREVHALEPAVVTLLIQVGALVRTAPARVRTAVRQLGEVLGDVVQPRDRSHDSSLTLAAEIELAFLLAGLLNGDCWFQFLSRENDSESVVEMATRALDLYERTDVYLKTIDIAGSKGRSLPYGAISLVRQIADGFALLATDWDDHARARLSLPSRTLVEFALREMGIDGWMAERGATIKSTQSPSFAESLIESAEESTWMPAVSEAFMTTVWEYEMLLVLCDSAGGRTTLHSKELQALAILRLNEARRIAGWVWQREPEAAGVAAAQVLVAQAFFVGTHGQVSSSRDLFPSRSELHEIALISDALEWFDGKDLDLPDWLLA